jgi:N,N-dimethylformamidase
MYLGGNGFYWKLGINREQPGLLEIRRAETGMRAWAAEPGEYFNALDGGYGGLWLRNGRPPQRLVGVGFSGEGPFWGKPYERAAGADDPRASFIFDGVNDNVLGDFGLSGGGAAGFEMDRAEPLRGTPGHALVLATAGDYPAGFMLAMEEWLAEETSWAGPPPDELLRADMVYFETDKGGAVFSVGSISFLGSLPYNNYDNNISTIVDNVLTRFRTQ